MAIELNKCPLCGSPIKMMFKPDQQLHCRGVCGLIVRVQNSDFEEKLVKYFDEKQNISKALDKIEGLLYRYRILPIGSTLWVSNQIERIQELESILKGEGVEQ